MNRTAILLLFCFIVNQAMLFTTTEALACNWGTQSTHPLPPNIAVNLLKDNGFDKVKLFEADPFALKALGNSGIQVMVGIQNELLSPLANSVQAAVAWVQANVSTYISNHGVDIRYVAVGNEPFLKTYNDSFTQITFPALKNVQAALIKAGLGKQVKATIPLNADVYQTDNGLPSGGNFRSDIRDLMVSIIQFLRDNNSPLTINIYPFLSLQSDPNFPLDYAFFDGSSPSLVDGSISYTNVFDANYDTLISALEKNQLSSMEVMIGEVGWPTDGDSRANAGYARRFYQGLLNKILQRQGTPKRPNLPEIYLFSLLDEDAKSIQPGNFERHWGIFGFDGSLKYQLSLGNGAGLVPARGVRYLARQYCVLSPQANLLDPNLANSVSYACTYADCTSLGFGSSCGQLDARSNVSYAFNRYYQTMNQQRGACVFSNLAVITSMDPSQNSCRFDLMIDTGRHESPHKPSAGKRNTCTKAALLMFLFKWISLHMF